MKDTSEHQIFIPVSTMLKSTKAPQGGSSSTSFSQRGFDKMWESVIEHANGNEDEIREFAKGYREILVRHYETTLFRGLNDNGYCKRLKFQH